MNNNNNQDIVKDVNPEISRIIYPNCAYIHFKGNIYYVDSITRHTETDELQVNYHALYGDGEGYSRPYDMFVEQVPEFSEVDNIADQTYRFEKLDGKIIYDKKRDCFLYVGNNI